MARRSFANLAVAVLVLVIAACGEAVAPVDQASEQRPATVAELRGPWRQAPLRLDVATRGRIEQACRREIEMPPGATAVVIDVRGAGVATIRIAGVNAGSCDALEISANGQIAGAGAGWRAPGPDDAIGLPAGKLGHIEKQTVGGGSLTVEGWSVYGRAGPGIASVVIEPQNHLAVIATLQNGWFAAWWPAQANRPNRDGAAHPPFVVRAYDPTGTLLDQIDS